MARARDLLDRFRPAGAPGAATAAGVPADRRESVAAELEPIFAALAPVQAECERLRRASAEHALAREATATRMARALLARARSESAAERAAAAATLRERAKITAGRTLAHAEDEAAEIRRNAEARRPDLVGRILERVRADLRGLVRGQVPPP